MEGTRTHDENLIYRRDTLRTEIAERKAFYETASLSVMTIDSEEPPPHRAVIGHAHMGRSTVELERQLALVEGELAAP